jgi:hypothetical protein
VGTNTIPLQHIAGDSFTATLTGADYSAADAWVASLLLIGPQRVTLSSSASGTDHAVAAEAAVTAVWAPGEYALRVLYTKAAERHSVDAGRLTVRPDPSATTTTAVALKSPAQRTLDALEAAYAAYLASGQFHVGEYTVLGRAVKYRSLHELIKALGLARRDVASETAANMLMAGGNPRQRFVTRM